MGKYGLDILELEQEFLRILKELYTLGTAGRVVSPADSQRTIAYSAFYLTEIVKRWTTPGMTVAKIREGSERALDRQIRRWGSEELKDLLKEVKGEGKEKQAGTAAEISGKTSTDTAGRTAETVGGSDLGYTRGNARPSSGPIDPPDDSPRGDPPGASERRAERAPDQGESGSDGVAEGAPGNKSEKPPADDGPEVDERENSMTPQTCPKCGSPMAPETEDPLPRSCRLCPACGWDPEKSPSKVPSGPQPPKAGKSFSGSKKR